MEIFLSALLLAQPREFEEPVATIEPDSLKADSFVVPPGWYGFVPASGPGIVDTARISLADGMKALRTLASPEGESRSQDFGGRRMVRIDGGYLILNFMRYRDYDHTAADRMRRLRERRRKGVRPNGVTVHPNVTHSRGQKTEAESRVIHTSSAEPTDAEKVYVLYPRRQGKKAALKAIENALKSKTVGELCEACNAFADATGRWPAGDEKFIPHPATWFNQGRYDDDRSTWIRRADPPRFQNPVPTDDEHAKNRF